MDNDSQTTTDCKEQPDEERQDGRQFFNGLGKWSLAIVAAVAALRDGLHDMQNAIGSRFGTGSEATGGPLERIARHGNSPHLNDHLNAHTDYTRTGHVDSAAMRGVTTPTGRSVPKGTVR